MNDDLLTGWEMLRGWSTLSRTERDAAYQNGAITPNVEEIQAERAAASATFRAARPGHLDIPYADGERNRWDLYPATNPDAPCLVFIHGGYWQAGSREAVCTAAEGVAAHGWSAACPGYTLAPEATMTEIIAQLHAALDWLVSNRRAHGISGPLIVSGSSAGGHLAAMMLGHSAIVAGLALSGVYELGPIRDTYLNAKLQITEAEIAACSPLRLPPVAKPLAIAYGTRELPALVGNSRALHAHRAAAHQPGALLPVVGAYHATVVNALRDPAGILTRAALDMAR